MARVRVELGKALHARVVQNFAALQFLARPARIRLDYDENSVIVMGEDEKAVESAAEEFRHLVREEG